MQIKIIESEEAGGKGDSFMKRESREGCLVEVTFE